MADDRICDGCGAPFSGPGTKCAYCGSGEAPPPSAREKSPREVAADLREQMRKAEELQTHMAGAPFWFLHGGIFILVGAIFTLTVIGAIVGIPAILTGVKSLERGFAARR